MYFRLLDESANKEIILNTDHITKIEVGYYVPSETAHTATKMPLRIGVEMPEAMRVYTLFFGNEKFTLNSEEPSKVLEYVRDIHRKATEE